LPGDLWLRGQRRTKTFGKIDEDRLRAFDSFLNLDLGFRALTQFLVVDRKAGFEPALDVQELPDGH